MAQSQRQRLIVVAAIAIFLATFLVRLERSIDLCTGAEQTAIIVPGVVIYSRIDETWMSEHCSTKNTEHDWHVMTSRNLYERFSRHFVYGGCSAQASQLRQICTNNRVMIAGREPSMCEALRSAWISGATSRGATYLERLNKELNSGSNEPMPDEEFDEVIRRALFNVASPK